MIRFLCLLIAFVHIRLAGFFFRYAGCDVEAVSLRAPWQIKTRT
jgi:hypothetical protein